MTYKKYRFITLKQYRLIVVSTIIIMMVLNGWAAVSGYPWLPAPVLIIGSIILIFSRRRVKELWVDEREYSIGTRAFTMACAIFITLASISGITLIAFGDDQEKPILLAIGLTLLGSVGALGIFFFTIKFYLDRKMSGKE
jgi:uncharacterized membrane protein